MSAALPLNEHFFDRESKRMWYVLGISYSRYFPERQRPVNTWSSYDSELITIVKRELASGHALIHEERTETFKVRMLNAHLQSMLFKRGCVPGKAKRKFPRNIKRRYLDHFVRGFFDAHVTVCHDNREHCHGSVVQIYLNPPFLRRLREALVNVNAVSKRIKVANTRLNYYSRLDIQGIHDFLYRDWDYIQEHGLYLPSKKERFCV